MDERLILGYMLGRDGLATYSEVLRHFEEVATADISYHWNMLKARRKIGILLDRGVFLLHDGAVVWTMSRPQSARYRILWA